MIVLRPPAFLLAVAGLVASPAAAYDPGATVAAIAAWARAVPLASYLQVRTTADLVHTRLLEDGVARAIRARAAEMPRASPRQPVYRLPVPGVIVTGFGEMTDSGAAARGPTIRSEGGSRVVAPATGRIGYADRFGGYGRLVIVDHGRGWTSAVSGLDSVRVKVGDQVRGGDVIGYVGAADPRITVELRRRGRPYDALSMIGL